MAQGGPWGVSADWEPARCERMSVTHGLADTRLRVLAKLSPQAQCMAVWAWGVCGWVGASPRDGWWAQCLGPSDLEAGLVCEVLGLNP